MLSQRETSVSSSDVREGGPKRAQVSQQSGREKSSSCASGTSFEVLRYGGNAGRGRTFKQKRFHREWGRGFADRTKGYPVLGGGIDSRELGT